MPLSLHPCTPSDLPRAVLTERNAFASDPFTPILFPGPFPDGTSEFRVQELAKQMAEDPSTRWLKVVDTGEGPQQQQQQAEVARAQSQGFGVAFAKYNVYVERRPAKGEKSGRTFGEGCNVEACETVFGTIAETRERMLGDRKCLYLANLFADPAYGRRGAGGMLIKWGIDEARKHGLPCYVESTRKGHELYKRYGFRDLEYHATDLSKFGAPGPHETWAMVWEAEAEA